MDNYAHGDGGSPEGKLSKLSVLERGNYGYKAYLLISGSGKNSVQIMALGRDLRKQNRKVREVLWFPVQYNRPIRIPFIRIFTR